MGSLGMYIGHILSAFCFGMFVGIVFGVIASVIMLKEEEEN